MSYLVLARKWRPRLFSDLVGQGHVARTLENAIRQERVAHAYLFAGPRGVGKTSTARILAAALNCEKGPTPEPCGKCEACDDVAAGRSLDVIEIDGASNRGIDEIRDLRESVRYMVSAGKKKVYIIDEVHMLTTEAFNALLKTLEEPPSHVLFVFATTRATKVPATILSRTIRFDFKRIRTKDIVGRLEVVAKGESFKADEKALHLVARAADGGMRDALSLLEQVRAFGGDKLTAEDVEEALGVVDEELLFDLSTATRDSNVAGAIDVVRRLIERGGDPGDFLLSLEEHFRNLLVAQVSEDVPSLIDAPDETVQRYCAEAASFEADDLIRMLSLLGSGARDLRNSPRPRLVLEMLLLRLVRMESTVDIGKLVRQLEKGGGGQGGVKKNSAPAASRPAAVAPRSTPAAPRREKPAPGPAAAPVNRPEEGSQTSATIADPAWNASAFTEQWPEFLTHISQANAMVASLLHGSTARGRANQMLEIVFPRGHAFQKEQAFERENRTALEGALHNFFHVTPRLKAIVGDHVLEGSTRKKEDLKKDPRINRILSMLDGEIAS